MVELAKPRLFPSLIGSSKTYPPPFYILLQSLVSIPHRKFKNGILVTELMWKKEVSIPHRKFKNC